MATATMDKAKAKARAGTPGGGATARSGAGAKGGADTLTPGELATGVCRLVMGDGWDALATAERKSLREKAARYLRPHLKGAGGG